MGRRCGTSIPLPAHQVSSRAGMGTVQQDLVDRLAAEGLGSELGGSLDRISLVLS